ncbi:MAG TPA: AsmA family protein [Burkholderiales bacterium]|nr:AsmA family protein [Burkholderiales bacterium]
MHTAIKWTLIGTGSAVAVVAAVVGYVAATFDPNEHKGDIVKAIRDKTGRTLVLKGDLGLSLFPSLGMKLGEAALSEPRSEREFARVASAVVSVKLMPLLSKEVVADAIEVKGLRATIVRSKAGKLNVDDLAGGESAKPEEKSAPLKVDIARVAVSDADVTYADESAGTRYRLSRLDLKTGRIANGVPTPVDFSATIASEKDRTQLDTKLKTKLTFDLERKLYRLEGLDLSAQGNYAGITDLKARVKGDVEARMASGEYAAKDLAVTVTGKRAGGDLDVKLDAPKLELTREKVDGGKVVLEARTSAADSKLTAKITAGGVRGAFSAIAAGPLDVDLESQTAGRTVKAKLAGALTASLDRKTAALDFSGKVDESSVKGKAAVTAFSPLALTFDLDADQLDVDRILGKTPSGKTADAKAAKPAAAPRDDKVDLSALKDVNAHGTLKIGKLTLLNLKTSQVRADIKVAGGRLDVAPMSAQLYEGALNGSLSAQAAEHAVFAVKQTLSNVSVGPLLRDAAQVDTLEGKGTVSADRTTRGASVDALKKALNGTVAVKLADGSVKGADIAGTIRNARNKLDQLRGQAVQSSSKTEKTDFSELTATFNVKNGVAHNDDLSLKSPLLRVGGAGDIDIGNDRLNYVLKATLVATSKGQGGREVSDLSGLTVPVKLTGALDAPQWSIDFAGMVADLARKQLKDEVLKRATGGQSGSGNVRDSVKERLKGIFGR